MQSSLLLPKSNFSGTGTLALAKTAGQRPEWSARADKAELQLQDALAWYRAFMLR